MHSRVQGRHTPTDLEASRILHLLPLTYVRVCVCVDMQADIRDLPQSLCTLMF